MTMENPFFFDRPVSGPTFVGRHAQVESIKNELLYGNQSVLITGGRRFGRSSMLAEIQRSLLQNLPPSLNIPGSYILPIMVNLRSLDLSPLAGSADLVKLLMLQQLHSFFTSSLLRRTLHIPLIFDISQTRLDQFIQSQPTHCTLYLFQNILEDLITFFLTTYDPLRLRLIFLLDETDKLLHKDWTNTIFDHWRTLISTDPLGDYLRLVLVGSTEIIEVREQGSALLISLKPEPLRPVSPEALQQITTRMPSLSPALTQAIHAQCAGHPYLTTRLLHSLWSYQQQQLPATIETLVADFHQQTLDSDLQQWLKDLGELALTLYQFLTHHPTGLTRSELDQSHPSRLTPSLERLLYHGLISYTPTDDRYSITGTLFQNWLSTQSLPPSTTQNLSSNPSSPRITVIPYPFLYPTSYAYSLELSYATQSFPMIHCIIDRSSLPAQSMHLTVSATLSSPPASDIRQIEILPDEKICVDLLPRLTPQQFQELQDTSPRSCQVTIQHDAPLGRNLYNLPHPLHLQAYNVAHLARLDSQDQLQEDLSDFLSIFVTPNRPEINQWIGQAASNYTSGQGFDGYLPSFWSPSAPDPNAARTAVRRQAEAIFKMLKNNARLHYVNSNFYDEPAAGQQQRFITQRLRLPFESLSTATGQANCLDGSLLFASLLLKINIHPLIVLVKDHAFVGWRIAPPPWINAVGLDPAEYCEFLETTMIHSSSFQQALSTGNQRYSFARTHLAGHPFWSNQGFLRIVDVVACRDRSILPLV